MRKKRGFTIKVERADKNTDQETYLDDECFEKKAETIRHNLEGLAAKMFLGVCVYVLLDTHRQVQIAKATRPDR
jgi:hypothetical protein